MNSYDAKVIFGTWEMVQREQRQGRLLTIDLLDVIDGYYAKLQADALMEPPHVHKNRVSIFRRIKFLFTGK